MSDERWPGSSEDRREKKWFDPSISLGNIITLVVLALSGFAWASTVEKTLAVHSLQIAKGEADTVRVESNIAQNKTDIRDSLKEIKDELKDLNQQIRMRK